MAANEAIIREEGQRYDPIKIDYTGYIQGLGSIATGLVAKAKEVKKNKSALNRLRLGVQTDITPWEDVIKNYIDNSEDSLETKQATVERLKNGTSKLELLQTKLAAMVESGLTKSLDPEVENWIISYAKGDFDQTFTIRSKQKDGDPEDIAETRKFNMNFTMDENFNPMVIGPKGVPIAMDEFENLLNVADKGDGESVRKLLQAFPTMSGVKAYRDKTKPSDDDFNDTRDEVLGQVTALFENGLGKISGDNIKTAFMFDSELIMDGKRVNFIDWYLSKPDLFPEEFEEKYDKYRKQYILGSEVEKKMLNIIAQDLIKNDPDIEEDLMGYVNSIFERNR